MDSPLERIAFLARSENRVRVLRAIAAETQPRQRLREELSISRTTLGRVLNEFERRNLIRRTAEGYTTTPAADATLERFVPLLETMEGIHNLDEAIEWLPPPARSVDFRHFRDARITTGTPDNPAAPFDRGLELIRAADTYRGLTSTAIPSYVRLLADGLGDGRLDVEGIIRVDFFETLRDDPERAVPWYDLVEAGAIWSYDGRVPINMHVLDDVVLVWLGEHDEDDLEVYGLLESRNDSVRAWADSLYADYRDEADPVDVAALPGSGQP
jgi:predicted transcriptional regulator